MRFVVCLKQFFYSCLTGMVENYWIKQHCFQVVLYETLRRLFKLAPLIAK